MDLWIRSQDKTILKCVKDIYCNCNNEILVNRNVLNEDYCDFDLVAKYKTKERALEVLDEIQNLLFTRIMCKADTTDDEADLLFCKESQGKMIPDTILFAKPINLNSIVYQMPEK